MSDFNPQYEWLGIPPHEQPADHYRLLGLARFESNPTVIANAADRQMSHLRMFQAGPRGKHALELIDAVSQAKACLMTPEKKEAYDQSIRPKETTQPQPAPAPQRNVEPIIFTPEKVENVVRTNTPKTSSNSSILQVAVGGAVGIGLAVAILWYGLGMDPLGIWSSRAKNDPNQVATLDQESANFKADVRDLRQGTYPPANMNAGPPFRPNTTPYTTPQRSAQTSIPKNEPQSPKSGTSVPAAVEPEPTVTLQNSNVQASTPEQEFAAQVNDQMEKVSERFSEGLQALQSGKAKAAERLFRECLDEGDNQVGTLNNLAVAYALQGKIPAAFQTLKRALESLHGENAEATAGFLTKNLNQLGWGVRNMKVTGVDPSDVETVAAVARRFQGTSDVPNRWFAFVLPSGLVAAGANPVEINYVCLHCEGRKSVKCPANGCRNGKLLTYTDRKLSKNVVQTVPVNVRCSACDGTGKVRCPSCQ
jgi:hypothetical protein